MSILSLIISIIFSCITIAMTVKHRKSDLKITENKDAISQLGRENDILFERIKYIPHFILDLNEQLEEIDDLIVIPVKLFNIGKESAVNIEILGDDSGIFIRTKDSVKVEHFIREYLNNYHAIPGAYISFKISCEKRVLGVDLFFDITFLDIVNRFL